MGSVEGSSIANRRTASGGTASFPVNGLCKDARRKSENRCERDPPSRKSPPRLPDRTLGRGLDLEPRVSDIAKPLVEVLLQTMSQELLDPGGASRGRISNRGSRVITAARTSESVFA